MLFDARVLAAYLVSSNVFANPLTRRPLRRETCASLDAHLEKHGRAKDATVARALDLSRDDDAQRRLQSERLRAESRRVLAALFGGDAESLGARQVRLAEDAARRAERAAAVWWSRTRTPASSRRRRRARRRAAAAGQRRVVPGPGERAAAPGRRRLGRARPAPRGLLWRRRLCGTPVRRVPGTATPSSRRRVDGVEDDAMIQHECAVKFDFRTGRVPGRAADERPPARAEPAPRGRVRRRSTARRANGRVAPALVLCRAQNQLVSRRRREMLISYTGPLGAEDARDPRRRFGRGGGALRALERKLARCCEADGEVPRRGARDAGRLDPRRRGRGALRLRAEEYADGAVRYPSCRRLPGARPPQPLLSEHAATAPPPPAPAPTAPPPPARAPPSPTSWTCDRCTLVNAPRHDGLPGAVTRSDLGRSFAAARAAHRRRRSRLRRPRRRLLPGKCSGPTTTTTRPTTAA